MPSTDLFDLTGRRAVVTGGGSGIGLAMAQALAAHGADVSLWGRDEERLRLAAATIAGPGRVTWRRVDVTAEADVVAGVEAQVAEAGGIEVAVLNAGTVGTVGPLLDSRTDDHRTTMTTNLDGAYWTLRESARAMAAGGAGGSVIAVSSLAALRGAARMQAYAASKAALLALANGAAVELARHGIRVNTVLPGWVATEMSRENQESQSFTDRVISRVPLRRWGNPDDLAGIAVYLASDAARFQTGSSVVIDGGYQLF